MGCCCSSFGTPSKTIVVVGTARSGATTVLLRLLLREAATTSSNIDSSTATTKAPSKRNGGSTVQEMGAIEPLTRGNRETTPSPERQATLGNNENATPKTSLPCAIPSTCADKDWPSFEFNKARISLVDGGPALRSSKDSVLFGQLAKADGILLVLDSTQSFAEQRAAELIAVLDKRSPSKASLFVLLNKFDYEHIVLTPQIIAHNLSSTKRSWVIQPGVAMHPRFDARKMLPFFFDADNYIAEPLISFSNEVIASAFVAPPTTTTSVPTTTEASNAEPLRKPREADDTGFFSTTTALSVSSPPNLDRSIAGHQHFPSQPHSHRMVARRPSANDSPVADPTSERTVVQHNDEDESFGNSPTLSSASPQFSPMHPFQPQLQHRPQQVKTRHHHTATMATSPPTGDPSTPSSSGRPGTLGSSIDPHDVHLQLPPNVTEEANAESTLLAKKNSFSTTSLLQNKSMKDTGTPQAMMTNAHNTSIEYDDDVLSRENDPGSLIRPSTPKQKMSSSLVLSHNSSNGGSPGSVSKRGQAVVNVGAPPYKQLDGR